MFDRRQEQETLPACLEHGIGVMAMGLLGHGLLTGAFTATTLFARLCVTWRGGPARRLRGADFFRENFKTNVGVVERIRREIAVRRVCR